MIINFSDEKKNTKTRVIFRCDRCEELDDRNMKSHFKLKKENIDFDRDFCKKCWCQIRQKTENSKSKMSEAINLILERDPEWKIRNSISKKGKINIGEKNGMKSESARKKVSKTRTNLMKNPEFRKIFSDGTKRAWFEGKFNEVAVGQSKWFEYIHSNEKTYKVQGTWELAFIKWLDDNNLIFDCHKGRLKYELEKNVHYYYPDFYVFEWNCYVDIKNDYHYSLQKEKFDALEKEGYVIKIILKDELQKLINYKL